MNKAELLEIAKQVFNDEVVGINQVMANLNDDFIKVIEVIAKCKGKIAVAGMGKSGHIAHKIAATLASTGTPAFFIHPAEALHGDLGMIESDDIVIAISYSGESEELLAIFPALRQKHTPIIAMTGNVDSTL